MRLNFCNIFQRDDYSIDYNGGGGDPIDTSGVAASEGGAGWNSVADMYAEMGVSMDNPSSYSPVVSTTPAVTITTPISSANTASWLTSSVAAIDTALGIKPVATPTIANSTGKTTVYSTSTGAATTATSSNTTTFILVGVLVLILVVTVIVLFIRKK